jgi:tyrosyl-tRNA synthetase
MQGYDFYWLHVHKGCKLQMGGSDQWGNITTGTELIRRKADGEAFAFTCPLITKADGGKFGKTEKGNVWLDPVKTSPYQFYQFWLNAADEDAEKWIRIFTLLPRETIESLLEEHTKDPGARTLQKNLAREVTVFVHGEQEYESARLTTEKLFQGNAADNIRALSESELLAAMEGVPACKMERSVLAAGIDIVSFLAQSSIFPSKGEARKTVQGGGVSVNKQKADDITMLIDESHLLAGKYILVQKGKKHHFLVEVF